MSRDPALRLEDILEAATAVATYVRGFDYDSFAADRRTVDAVTRNLEIIGEAVKHLPSDLTDTLPEIPWRAIAGFRDIPGVTLSGIELLQESVERFLKGWLVGRGG
jgi:uncharacterized protein with HEPN domain